VVFTAGGNAAGKSTAISFTQEASRAQVVFDSTFSNWEHALSLVDQALAADKRVTVLYVNRPLEDAFLGMLDRAGREGRVVTISQLIGSHRGAAATVRRLWIGFSSDARFQFRFVDNSCQAPRLGTIELAVPQDYNEVVSASMNSSKRNIKPAELPRGSAVESEDIERVEPTVWRRPDGGRSGGGSPQAGTGESLP